MHESHEATASGNARDPLLEGHRALDEDLDYEEPKEAEEPDEEPPPTEYPGGGDGVPLPAPGTQRA